MDQSHYLHILKRFIHECISWTLTFISCIIIVFMVILYTMFQFSKKILGLIHLKLE